MKSFEEFLAEEEQLDEGIIRTGAIMSYGAQSRKAGDDSVRAFRSGQEALRRGSVDLTAEERLERIEGALDALFDGLIKQRQQIGAGVAVDVAGHSLSVKARNKR
jgi:uncharacterized protein YaiE (UPF0345 family)